MTKEVMTTKELAQYLGYTNVNGARSWACRYAVKVLYRQAGVGGMNVYARDDVDEGIKRMVGQGRRK